MVPSWCKEAEEDGEIAAWVAVTVVAFEGGSGDIKAEGMAGKAVLCDG